MSVPAPAEADPRAFAWGEPGPSATLTAVRRRARAADGVDPLDEAAQLRLQHAGLRDGGRLWLAGEAGAALILGRELTLVVDPAERGRGIGAALLAAALDVAPTDLTAWSHGDHPAASRLADRYGFERARELWLMRRPAALPLAGVDLPEGVRIRGYQPTDAPALLAVNAAAFADHPEQGGMDEANLAARMAQPWFDPEGLLVAEDDTGVVGFHWTKREPGADHGEVYVVGVAPRGQGRGLGRALTLAGLHHLAGLGIDEIRLYTESDNVPARTVYARVGFTHDPKDTHVWYRWSG